MLQLQKHIAKLTEQTRLSDYAIGIFEAIPTRKGIKKAIKKGAIYVNGEVGQTGTWIVKFWATLVKLDTLLSRSTTLQSGSQLFAHHSGEWCYMTV